MWVEPPFWTWLVHTFPLWAMVAYLALGQA